MAIIQMPASWPVDFKSVRLWLSSNTQTFISPLSRSAQTLELTGTRWMANYEIKPLKRVDAIEWMTFLVELNGRAGRFFARIPSPHRTPRGVATGIPLVDGAGQTGTTLNTKGWTASVTGILLKGDFFTITNPSTTAWLLHMVMADANSDGGGLAAFTIAPPLRISPPDNSVITTANPFAVMMLASDEQAAFDIDTAQIHGIRFSAEEAFKT